LRTRALWCAAVATFAASGCGPGFQPSRHTVPAPAAALAAAPLSGDVVAILSGDDRAKAISLVNLDSGAVVRSFGVTKEASDLSSSGPDGPLLLSISGIGSDGQPMGAVESWSLEGSKERVIPLPLQAMNLTRNIGGTVFVLIANGKVRAAVPLNVVTLQPGPAIPLDAYARKLEQCRVGTTSYLVYSHENGGTVAVRDLRTGASTHSTVAGDDPTCVGGTPGVYAMQKSLVNDQVAVFDLPGLRQQGHLPAEHDTIALYETLDHHLIALDATQRVSTVEEYPAQTLGPISDLR
jgi:hypothetical protein